MEDRPKDFASSPSLPSILFPVLKRRGLDQSSSLHFPVTYSLWVKLHQALNLSFGFALPV